MIKQLQSKKGDKSITVKREKETGHWNKLAVLNEISSRSDYVTFLKLFGKNGRRKWKQWFLLIFVNVSVSDWTGLSEPLTKEFLKIKAHEIPKLLGSADKNNFENF